MTQGKYPNAVEGSARTAGGDSGKRGAARRRRAMAERQASILARAADHLPHSVPLRLARLAVAATTHGRDEVQNWLQQALVSMADIGSLLATQQVEGMWRKALSQAPTESSLWLAYMRFQASHYSSFSVSKASLYSMPQHKTHY